VIFHLKEKKAPLGGRTRRGFDFRIGEFQKITGELIHYQVQSIPKLVEIA